MARKKTNRPPGAPRIHRVEPASTIVDACGGAKALAGALGITPAAVHRWTWPLAANGTGGLIPARWHYQIFEIARSRGADLSPALFLVTPVQSAA